VPNQVIANDDAATPARGRFARLLQDVPGLRKGLDQMLLDSLKDKPWAEVPSPAAYHSLFKNLLARANCPLDDYPYNTVSMAYESIRRDLNERWVLFCQAHKARRRAFTELLANHGERWIYDRIEIDEQLIDCEESSVGIELSFGDRLPPLRLSRITLLAAIDTATDCIVGFLLALTSHARQDDMLALLQQCVSRWPERTITMDWLVLPPGPGFPNNDPSLPLPFPREVALDNAWMHHAHSVEAFVTQELGATLSFGRPKSPTLRAAIETSFNRLNQWLSHRLPSTTGSSVTDPIRESAKNRKGVPVVSLPTFEDALYVTLAESNHRSRSQLATATPLDTLRHQAGRAYFMDVDDACRVAWNPFNVTREVHVHDLSAPERKPYINFEYLRYKGPGLLALPEREAKVLIRYDRRDVRRVEAFRLNGQALGPLVCPSSWQIHPHGIDTRKYLFKHHRQLIRRSRDPLTEYFRQQRAKLSNPTDLVKFLRIYQEFVGGFGLPTSLWPQMPPREEGQASDQPIGTPQNQRSRPTSAVTKRQYWSLQLNPGGKQ
jgi:transposase InsO family protein